MYNKSINYLFKIRHSALMDPTGSCETMYTFMVLDENFFFFPIYICCSNCGLFLTPETMTSKSSVSPASTKIFPSSSLFILLSLDLSLSLQFCLFCSSALFRQFCFIFLYSETCLCCCCLQTCSPLLSPLFLYLLALYLKLQ